MSNNPSAARTALLGSLTLAIALFCSLAVVEVVLRVVYRDGGRRTLNGPGGQSFEYTFADAKRQLRGPLSTGAKALGVSRVMVLGDSITWGQGVPQWTDTYPARLLQALNVSGHGYDMAVYARPGRELDAHASTIAEVAPVIHPDVVVYQWYNNDMEFSKAGRPVSHRFWRSWPWHAAMKSHSYSYFVLDFGLDALLPQPGRSYLQYLEEDYAEATPAWLDFTRAFHVWATYATGHARQTILMLYPPVPSSALKELRARVTRLAAGQSMTITAENMAPETGSLIDGNLRMPSGRGGVVAHTPGLPLAHGAHEAVVRMRLTGEAVGELAAIDVVMGPALVTVATQTVAAEGLSSHEWVDVHVPFALAAPVSADVSVRIRSTGSGHLEVSQVEWPLRYGIEVLDLEPHFGAMRTSSSLFDAHPNAEAHRVMAKVLADRIQARAAASSAEAQ